jgi:hypothetical protein
VASQLRARHRGALTASETEDLLGFRDANTLRTGIVMARCERGERPLAKGILPSQAETDGLRNADTLGTGLPTAARERSDRLRAKGIRPCQEEAGGVTVSVVMAIDSRRRLGVNASSSAHPQ